MSQTQPVPDLSAVSWSTDAPALGAALASLAAVGPALVARTEAWSAINSGSREAAGLARMAEVLVPALAVLPGVVRAVPLPPSPRVLADGRIESTPHAPALELQVRPEAPIQVALTGHYDTVFPAVHPFQVPHRSADGRVLHGPGVADMKGGIAVMLAALEAFETLPQASGVGYTVLLSPDEEIGSPASAPLLAALGARSHLGMTYEPCLPSGAVVSARKGSGNFALVLRGRAAHVGRAFGDGRSAVVAAADAVLRLDALNGQRPGVTVNIGSVDGGAAVNVVPEVAVVRFNVRLPDRADALWLEGALGELVAAVQTRDGITAELHGGITRGAKPLTPPQAAVLAYTQACGAALGLTLEGNPTGGVCEGNNLYAAGCPNIDTLGPRGGGLHSDEEYALTDSFAERAQLSLLMLAGLALGRFDPRPQAAALRELLA
jgi:glutamate carboxypeptidase